MQQKNKHIILISLDDLRGDCVGENKYRFFPANLRHKFRSTHNYLDVIAKKGLHFNKCFTSAPYTTASHASILTGFSPLHHGLYEYYNAQISQKTIFEIAKSLNWKTLIQTDFPIMLSKALGFGRSVDDYFVEEEFEGLKKLRENMHTASTMSLFHFGGIHYPYGFHKLKFGGNDYKNKIAQLEKEEHIATHTFPKDQLDETIRNRQDKELLFRYKTVLEKLYKDKNFTKLTAMYLDGIEYFLTHRFQPFLEALFMALRDMDYTIVIFGDHGEEWSPTSEGHYKSLSYGVLNVPLIVLGPDVTPGIVTENVRTIDIVPSLVRLMNPKKSYVFDGEAIDFTHPVTLRGSNRISIAQTWLGFGKDALRDHIRNAEKQGKVTKKMQTIKRGESAILRDFQLLRLYDKSANKILEADISQTSRSMPKAVHVTLDRTLAKYNNDAPTVETKLSADEKIRQELRLMGYEI